MRTFDGVIAAVVGFHAAEVIRLFDFTFEMSVVAVRGYVEKKSAVRRQFFECRGCEGVDLTERRLVEKIFVRIGSILEIAIVDSLK